jgi:hypothetical protein
MQSQAIQTDPGLDWTSAIDKSKEEAAPFECFARFLPMGRADKPLFASVGSGAPEPAPPK